MSSDHAQALVHAALLFAATLSFAMVLGLVGQVHTTQMGMLAALSVQQIGVVGGLTALWMRRSKLAWRVVLGRVSSTGHWALAVCLAAPGLVLLQAPLLEAWASLIGAPEPQWYAVALNLDGPGAAAAVFIAVAVIPPICEELFFRGYLLHRLRSLGAVNAVVIQALIFTLYHNDAYGVPVYLVTGTILGAVRLYAGALWPAIVIHAINNVLGVLDFDRGESLYDMMGPLGLLLGAVLVGAAVFLVRPYSDAERYERVTEPEQGDQRGE